MTALEWFCVGGGALFVVLGVLAPIRHLTSERARRMEALTGTPWWVSLGLVPVGGLLILGGVIHSGWPALGAVIAVYAMAWFSRRNRREVDDPPPMFARMDARPLHPFWGFRHPVEYGRWMADLSRVRRNQQEFREWQQRHGLR